MQQIARICNIRVHSEGAIVGSIEIFNYLPEYLFTDLPRLITAGLTAIGVTFGSVEPPF